jgi:hypothetical protein
MLLCPCVFASFYALGIRVQKIFEISVSLWLKKKVKISPFSAFSAVKKSTNNEHAGKLTYSAHSNKMLKCKNVKFLQLFAKKCALLHTFV